MISKSNLFFVILSVAKNPKNQSKVFGYFAYAQYDNEEIKRMDCYDLLSQVSQ